MGGYSVCFAVHITSAQFMREKKIRTKS
jgi:hypothetical protein